MTKTLNSAEHAVFPPAFHFSSFSIHLHFLSKVSKAAWNFPGKPQLLTHTIFLATHPTEEYYTHVLLCCYILSSRYHHPSILQQKKNIMFPCVHFLCTLPIHFFLCVSSRPCCLMTTKEKKSGEWKKTGMYNQPIFGERRIFSRVIIVSHHHHHLIRVLNSISSSRVVSLFKLRRSSSYSRQFVCLSFIICSTAHHTSCRSQ